MPPIEDGLNIKKEFRWNSWPIWTIASSLFLILLAMLWYIYMLMPVGDSSSKATVFQVPAGSSSLQIASNLADNHLIRSELAFRIYAKASGQSSKFRTGTYTISPGLSTQDIVRLLVDGKQDVFTITFYPGATLYDKSDITDSKRTDTYTMLKRAGYTDAEIRTAFSANYDSPLFKDKPANTSLEGYVYGETYQFEVGVSVENILETTFDLYWQKIQDNSIVTRLRAQGLNLYQGITLASIVQREVETAADQRQVAQVFYSRLDRGMPLGSDVTFIYAASQLGVTPASTLASPYNTRIHKGLPPGPISVPGLTALEAVANPAAGNYLYFVAGDDRKTYFSKTIDEHEKNVAAHCSTLCTLP